MTEPTRSADYVRSRLVSVLIEHQRLEGGACECGYAVLGASWARHVAQAYEERSFWERQIDGGDIRG